MPITNPDEIDTLSPLGEHMGTMIHRIIKENVTITGVTCPDNNQSHEGLYYDDDGSCFECSFKAKYGIGASLALDTFLDPETSPWNYTQFLGRYDPEDWGSMVLFAKACVRCGTNLRYAQGSNSICVCCSGMMVARDGGWQEMERWSKQPSHPMPPSAHWDRFLRDIAVAKGDATYPGRPCDTHGPKIMRYSSNGRCTECVKERNEGYYKKAATGHPAAARKRVDFDDIFG